MKILKTILLVVCLAAAAGGLAWYWELKRIHPSTDDAYVGTHVLTISPQVEGEVIKVNVVENAHVAAGDVLVVLDDRRLQAAVDEAKAQLDSALQTADAAVANVSAAKAALAAAEAAVVDSDASRERIASLFKRGDTSKAALDAATATRDANAARRDQAAADLSAARKQLGAVGEGNSEVRAAQATLDQARLALSHTTITAPSTGWIANLSLRPGDIVEPGQSLFALVEDGTWWVDANFRETDLPRIRPGQPARLAIDMYPGLELSGTVDSIGAGSGAVFALLPAQNATGNWVKVTQRFPVRITVTEPPSDPAQRLRVGASVTATVDTTGLDGSTK
ncbi:HlyD family secretion protein [Tropicimonas sp. IMCC34043]|uniref:HlyD family secretion protein n=1 Tax=Tropicimonas sp. IMCC34043 TaxID=2248760 RepID=UPI000E26322B|nr:HlyD family secretion protein [Tropicimonas sp. IMCC34043]